ncbi:hypothetical protein [Corynebacterium halotolerans]|uniref:hypothetical protein n=1 Tax=Corynebacterium halotolerans TaxID=225326 RepID=UPI003CFA71E8
MTPPTGAHQREQLFGDLRSLLLRDRLQNRLERGQEKLRVSSRSAVSWIIGIAGVLPVLAGTVTP